MLVIHCNIFCCIKQLKQGFLICIPELDGQRRIFLCGFAHGFQQRPVDRQTVLIGFFCVLNHVFDKCPASVRVFALCDNSNRVG